MFIGYIDDNNIITIYTNQTPSIPIIEDTKNLYNICKSLIELTGGRLNISKRSHMVWRSYGRYIEDIETIPQIHINNRKTFLDTNKFLGLLMSPKKVNEEYIKIHDEIKNIFNIITNSMLTPYETIKYYKFILLEKVRYYSPHIIFSNTEWNKFDSIINSDLLPKLKINRHIPPLK